MKKLNLLLISLLLVVLTGCGSSNDSETTTLPEKLKGNTFYVVEDGAVKSNISKISFANDDNITKWNIISYTNSFDEENNGGSDVNITVTDNTLTISGIKLILDSNEDDYINLISESNSLLKLKFFDTMDDANHYYYTSLLNELKNKQFYSVQNTLTERTLLKLKFDENIETWDMIVYDKVFDDENITGTDIGVLITVTDENITINKTNASFRLNSKEKDYLNLVSTIDTKVTLKLYESSVKAMEYFNSLDLRDELKNKTFYVVNINDGNKSLIKFSFTEILSQWEYSLYNTSYSTNATQTGTSNILVSENILQEINGDSLQLTSKEDNYINLVSLSNVKVSYRFYLDQNLAEQFYNNK